MCLEEKVAVYSASANGRGKTAAQLFAKEGAKVMLADLLNAA